MKERILTRSMAMALGLDRVSVITADMLDELGFTAIGGSAFYNCHDLESIEIPDGIVSIGSNAFYDCSHLAFVKIPNSVARIGRYAFGYCNRLSSIEIPDGVVIIDSAAFYNCCMLAHVTIGNSVTSIGNVAFEYCKRLASIKIPNSVTVIEANAFYGCDFSPKGKRDEKGRIIAYKGFDSDMTCRDFQYEEGKTYELDGEPELCAQGFHACLNPLDCFTYYYGRVQKEVVFHEVYLEGVSPQRVDDSKVVAKRITIGREISLSEMADIASGRK